MSQIILIITYENWKIDYWSLFNNMLDKAIQKEIKSESGTTLPFYLLHQHWKSQHGI